MQPELRERSLAAIVLGLRNLASMMRESQIGAASMNIDALTEVPHHHSTTLDMPTWPPRPPWALPCWLARSLGLPQHKIQRIAFAFVIREITTLISNCQQCMII